MSRAVLLRLPIMLALSACASGPMGGDAVGPSGTASERRTDLETQMACRDRANQMYEQRDRARIYAPNTTANTPYSANSDLGVTSHGLSNQFAYEQTIAECERAGTGSTDTSAQTPAPPPAKGR
jgi:hypothetical protein